jgi:hypothetical protein
VLRRRLLAGAAAAPLAAALQGCGAAAGRLQDDTIRLQRSRVAGLDAQEYQWARTAWRYIENNTDYTSGLVNGVDRRPLFTAWNAGDAIAATLAARELRIIDNHEFERRMSRLLGFLGSMDLSDGKLPNKAYNSATGKMVGFDNRNADIGWSAIDAGRLLLWLRIVGQRVPRLREYADKAVLRWSFCEVIDDCGRLQGTSRGGNGQLQRYQEGRLGYEQLAAAGYAAWGFDTTRSAALPALETVNILGLPIRYDARDPRTTGAAAPVLTMPYVLAGLEFGWQAPGGSTSLREPAQQVFRVQEQRWRREGQWTARSDYQSLEAPFSVLDSVYASGYAWNTIGGDGKEYERLALVNTRAAFGMRALWPGEYTRRLVESVQYLYDADRGWYEGRFEQGGAPHALHTLSTNAAVLEALAYQVRGPAWSNEPQPPGLFEQQTSDPFGRLGRCWPSERGGCKG